MRYKIYSLNVCSTESTFQWRRGMNVIIVWIFFKEPGLRPVSTMCVECQRIFLQRNCINGRIRNAFPARFYSRPSHTGCFSRLPFKDISYLLMFCFWKLWCQIGQFPFVLTLWKELFITFLGTCLLSALTEPSQCAPGMVIIYLIARTTESGVTPSDPIEIDFVVELLASAN